MTGEEAGALVTTLKAAYEREQVSVARLQLYIEHLQGLPYAPCQAAVKVLVRTSRYWPTLADIYDAVAEAQLALPGPAAAYELALVWAHSATLYAPCATCSGQGYRFDIDDVDPPVCGDCGGQGETKQPPVVPLPDVVRHAAEVCGGKYGLRNTTGNETSVLRGQFMKAYIEFRNEAKQQVLVPERALAATPAPLALPPAPMPQLRDI